MNSWVFTFVLSLSQFSFSMSGGVNVQPNDPLLRHFVGLYIDNVETLEKGICTGTIIGTRTILTSAHCLVGDPNKIVVYISFTNEPYKVLKEEFLGKKPKTYLKAKSFILNPKYLPNGSMKDLASNDVAVVHLEDSDSLPVGYGPVDLISAYSSGPKPTGVQVYSTGSTTRSNQSTDYHVFKKDNFYIVRNLDQHLKVIFGSNKYKLASKSLDFSLPSEPYFLAFSSRSASQKGDSGSAALVNLYGMPKVYGVLRGEYLAGEKPLGTVFTRLDQPSLNLWLRNQTR